ncbi:MAG: glyoxalase/bleomycin resistance/extradiol dioxygenase family protein [Tabrizicola sp.]|nr:glyoxalase/bleomycin resistance/extradiol dioxygenase family protein [Tabrizicola sp.]
MDDIPHDRRYRPEDRIMQGVIPYLSLAGKAGEAADFYVKAFAAKDIGRMPFPDKPGFMHLQLEINGGALMLTDHVGEGSPEGPPLARGHLQLVVGDGRAWFDRAVAAGCVSVMPFERQPWGDDWGMVRDPYGILWAVLTPDPALWDRDA